MVAVWFFEPYMLPISLLLVFLKNLAFSSMQTAFSTEQIDDVSCTNVVFLIPFLKQCPLYVLGRKITKNRNLGT